MMKLTISNRILRIFIGFFGGLTGLFLAALITAAFDLPFSSEIPPWLTLLIAPIWPVFTALLFMIFYTGLAARKTPEGALGSIANSNLSYSSSFLFVSFCTTLMFEIIHRLVRRSD